MWFRYHVRVGGLSYRQGEGLVRSSLGLEVADFIGGRLWGCKEGGVRLLHHVTFDVEEWTCFKARRAVLTHPHSITSMPPLVSEEPLIICCNSAMHTFLHISSSGYWPNEII